MKRLINVLFFASGISSLIFQVIWQRKLFTIFGINIESTTIVVSVFMASLGLGALTGMIPTCGATSL
jgi:xanthine/uracil permease